MTNTERFIVEATIEINLNALRDSLANDDQTVPPTKRNEWGNSGIQQYRIFSLPFSAEVDWYYHQNMGAFSHSFEGSDILSSNEVEWRMVAGHILVNLDRNLIFAAPIEEAAFLQGHGKTTFRSGSFEADVIQVSIEDFDDLEISRWIDRSCAQYSNLLVSILFEVPVRPVLY